MNNPYGSRFERDDQERRSLRESRDQRYGGERRFRSEEHNDDRLESESGNRQSYGREDDPFGGEQRWSGQRGYPSSRRSGSESFSGGSGSDWRSYPGQSRSFERGGYESDREPWEGQRGEGRQYGQHGQYGQRYGSEGRYGSFGGEQHGRREQHMGGRSGGYGEGGYQWGQQSGQHSGSSNYWEHGGGGPSYHPGYGGQEQRYGGMAGSNYWQHGGSFGAGSAGAMSGASRSRPPKGYTRSDERLKEDICEHLMSTPWIDAGEVSVEVKDGNVKLEGTVPERSMKHRIEDIAEECPGVKSVDNRVRVERQEHGGSQQGAGSMGGQSGSAGMSAHSGGTHQGAQSGAQTSKSK